jgi:hypothetical protein
MPDSRSPAGVVLEALGYALFVRGDDALLRAVETPPEWLRELWPALGSDAQLPTSDASPFLENFLIDAEECWRAGGDQRAHSGPWIEQSSAGEQVQLEATALNANGQALLLIKQLGEEFEAKKEVLQKARETVIAHQRLNSEIQKKEILLHCVADEMTAALANIVTSLRLIENEPNPPRSKVLLGLAMRGTEEQQRLINRVLDVFAEEMESIYGGEGTNGEVADWDAVLRLALDAAEPAYREKNVRLSIEPRAPDRALKIPGNAEHLERIVSSLLENSLERTDAGGEVKVSFETEPDALLFTVTDGGPKMSAGACEDVFAKVPPPSTGSTAAALRLHFCRVMVESCGGEIGCAPGETNGNSIWFRLPRIVAA